MSVVNLLRQGNFLAMPLLIILINYKFCVVKFQKMSDDWPIIVSSVTHIIRRSYMDIVFPIHYTTYVISAVYCVINLALFHNVVIITSQPRNVIVCLSQTTTANFTCVVNAGSIGITSVGWNILVEEIYVSVVGRPRHMVDIRTSVVNTDTVITETLTVTDVSLSDNGTKYRCQPFGDMISDVVTLTVIGKVVISLSTYAYTYVQCRYICMYQYQWCTHLSIGLSQLCF